MEENLKSLEPVNPAVDRPAMLKGNRVPFLQEHQSENGVYLTLDNRYSILVDTGSYPDILWFIANAIAIAEGYPSFEYSPYTGKEIEKTNG